MEASTLPTTPCFFCLIFFNDKMFVRNNRVDFSLNPGYSVGSLRGSGTQQFRQLTKQVLFTSAPVAACNAFHTQEKDQRGREHTAGEWMSQVGCLFKPRREQLCVAPRSAFHSIYTTRLRATPCIWEETLRRVQRVDRARGLHAFSNILLSNKHEFKWTVECVWSKLFDSFINLVILLYISSKKKV